MGPRLSAFAGRFSFTAAQKRYASPQTFYTHGGHEPTVSDHFPPHKARATSMFGECQRLNTALLPALGRRELSSP